MTTPSPSTPNEWCGAGGGARAERLQSGAADESVSAYMLSVTGRPDLAAGVAPKDSLSVPVLIVIFAIMIVLAHLMLNSTRLHRRQ